MKETEHFCQVMRDKEVSVKDKMKALYLTMTELAFEEKFSYCAQKAEDAGDYVKATDIKFTVKNSSELETVTMKDKQVFVSKTTVGGEEVIGAHMQIIDEDGNIIDEWTSEGKVHYATGLVEGKKYILHEDLAPTGLNLANDIEFEVSYAKENQKVEMIDTINEVSKVDEKGKVNVSRKALLPKPVKKEEKIEKNEK